MEEHIIDVINKELLSDCCSAAVYNPSGDPEDCICLACKEPCGACQEE